MKVVLFCGGKGSRLSESGLKPMTMIGNKPIVWHIMNWYSKFGYNDFILLSGYKQELLKEYFFHYYYLNSDITIDLKTNDLTIHKQHSQNWKVTLVDTGIDTNTAGRLHLAKPFLENEQSFLLNYSDGLSDVDINEVVDLHMKSNAIVTLTAFQPSARFGYLDINHETGFIKTFKEKSLSKNSFVNGGYFVCNRKLLDEYVTDDLNVQFEVGPLANVAKDGKLNCYKHYGFLSPMDTPKDKSEIIRLWESGNAPWKV